MIGDHKKTLKINKGSFNSVVANQMEDISSQPNLKPTCLASYAFIKLTIKFRAFQRVLTRTLPSVAMYVIKLVEMKARREKKRLQLNMGLKCS